MENVSRNRLPRRCLLVCHQARQTRKRWPPRPVVDVATAVSFPVCPTPPKQPPGQRPLGQIICNCWHLNGGPNHIVALITRWPAKIIEAREQQQQQHETRLNTTRQTFVASALFPIELFGFHGAHLTLLAAVVVVVLSQSVPSSFHLICSGRLDASLATIHGAVWWPLSVAAVRGGLRLVATLGWWPPSVGGLVRFVSRPPPVTVCGPRRVSIIVQLVRRPNVDRSPGHIDLCSLLSI